MPGIWKLGGVLFTSAERQFLASAAARGFSRAAARQGMRDLFSRGLPNASWSAVRSNLVASELRAAQLQLRRGLTFYRTIGELVRDVRHGSVSQQLAAGADFAATAISETPYLGRYEVVAKVELENPAGQLREIYTRYYLMTPTDADVAWRMMEIVDLVSVSSAQQYQVMGVEMVSMTEYTG